MSSVKPTIDYQKGYRDGYAEGLSKGLEMLCNELKLMNTVSLTIKPEEYTKYKQQCDIEAAEDRLIHGY